MARLAPAAHFTNSLRVGLRFVPTFFIAALFFEIVGFSFSPIGIPPYLFHNLRLNVCEAEEMVGPLYHPAKQKVKKFPDRLD
ncbi:MAG: hypothetical protein GZ088_13035 [Acidipila sp.]|nr:hypothetical protein [Acidipila sp.]